MKEVLLIVDDEDEFLGGHARFVYQGGVTTG
jgi:hypothetical protein